MSKQCNILSVIALPLLLVGCAHQSSVDSSGGNFSDPDDLVSSASSTPRVSGTTTATAPRGGLATLTLTNSQESADGSSPADPVDRELVETVRNLLVADKTLAPHPSQVTVSLHPDEKGAVILSGNVPTGQVKKRVIDRVASLPGVTRVEDRIEVGVPKDPGTAKYGDIVPQSKQ